MSLSRILFTCAVFLGICTQSAQARNWEDIKKDGKIIVATEGSYSPFNYYKGSKLTGFEVELTELLVKKLGVAIQWRTLGFDSLLAGLRQDRWDLVISSHGITEERERAVTFTDPHYCSGGVILSTDPALRAAKDLSGKTVSVLTGSTYLEKVNKLGTVKSVKNFPADPDARNALINRRVDAWVTDKFVAKFAMSSAPAGTLHMGDYLFVERIAAAVAKGNVGLSQAYNQALGELFKDGSYAALSKKYFNEDIRCK